AAGRGFQPGRVPQPVAGDRGTAPRAQADASRPCAEADGCGRVLMGAQGNPASAAAVARSRVASQRTGLASHLGLRASFFASPAERRLASAVEEGLVAVESLLAEQLTFTDPIADATSRYLFEAGGKRVRPALALLAAQLGDGNTDGVLAAAQAIELTHLA